MDVLLLTYYYGKISQSIKRIKNSRDNTIKNSEHPLDFFPSMHWKLPVEFII